MSYTTDMSITAGEPKRCFDCGVIKPLSEFHKDKTKKDGRTSRCKECAKKATRTWVKENKDRKRQHDKDYAKSHPDRKRKAFEKWYASNAHVAKQRAKDWRHAHPEKILALSRRWIAHNLEVKRSYTRNRRAKRKGNGGTITAKEWQAVLKKYGNRCLVPGCTRTDVTMDHVIPLDLGGPHTIDNVQPLCAHHNLKKQNTIIDYRPLYEDE